MPEKGFLSAVDISVILTGIIVGTIARIATLKVDYRQTPTFPNGYFINLLAGFIASALGAVVIPALEVKDFAAITFFAIAIQHFRDIRKMEMESLEQLEHTEYVRRGSAYIDGIAKTYEARNYISLLSSAVTVFVMMVLKLKSIPLSVLAGAATGFIVAWAIKRFTQGKSVGDICTVHRGEIEVKGSEVYVDGMFVTNLLGIDRGRELFIKEGLAAVIEPKEAIFRVTLENFGQRQAILFEAARALGVKRYNFTRRNFDTGKIIVALVPILNDPDLFLSIIKNTPILENSRKIHKIMRVD